MAKKRLHGCPTPEFPPHLTRRRWTGTKPARGQNYIARFAAPEFTTLCPITGQPDFAHLVIDYLPARYFGRNRNRSSSISIAFVITAPFTRTVPLRFGKKLAALLKPKWLRIGGYWYPRGGMPIDVFWQTGTLPKDVWLPDQVSRPIAAAARPLTPVDGIAGAGSSPSPSVSALRR